MGLELSYADIGILFFITWVLAVLQASLAVQIVIHNLRVLEILHSPAS